MRILKFKNLSNQKTFSEFAQEKGLKSFINKLSTGEKSPPLANLTTPQVLKYLWAVKNYQEELNN